RIDGVKSLGRREGLLKLLLGPALGFFLLASTLLLRSLLCLGLRLRPALFFIGAPLGFCPLMLRSLSCLGLRLPPAPLFVGFPLGLLIGALLGFCSCRGLRLP